MNNDHLSRIHTLKSGLSTEQLTEKSQNYQRGDNVFVQDHHWGRSAYGVREDNGRIEIFAKEGLGIRIDPVYDAITFYAPRLYFDVKEIEFYSSTIRYNKFPLNLKPVYNVVTPVGPGTGEGMLKPISELPLAASRMLGRILHGVRIE